MKQFAHTLIARRRTPLVWLIAVLVVVLLGAGVATAVSGSGTRMLTQQATVSRGTIDTTVPAVGRLSRPSNVALNFGATGTVTAVDVKPGEHVAAGQVLATLATTSARAQLATAHAVLDRTERTRRALLARTTATGVPASTALVAQDQATIDGLRQRTTNLSKQLGADGVAMSTACAASGSPAGSAEACVRAEVRRLADHTAYATMAIQLTDAGDVYADDVLRLPGQPSGVDPNQLVNDDGAVARAQQNVVSAERELAGTRITAPASGTVTAVTGAVGATEVEIDNAAGRVAPAQASPTLASPAAGAAFIGFRPDAGVGAGGALVANMWVTSGGVQGLLPGQSATVAIGGGQRAATVIGIGSRASKTNGQWAYPVTLWLTPTSGAAAARPGTSVTAQVVTASRPDVVYVPRGAVVNHHGTHEVTVVEGTTQRIAVVWPGYHGSVDTEVIGGVSPGERVVVRVPADNPSDEPTF